MKKDKVKLIDWKVNGEKMVFFEALGGRALCEMDAERFGLLMNGDYVRGELSAVAQEKLYPQDWGVKELVAAQRLMRKGLDQEMISRLWGVPPEALRLFYGAALQKYAHGKDAIRKEQELQESSETEKDYCLSLRPANVRLSEDPCAGQDFLELARVSALLNEKGIVNTAHELYLDEQDFRLWIVKNEKYLLLTGYKF